MQALEVVDRVLSRPLWATPGTVLGVLEVRRGIKVDVATVVRELGAAGYSKVTRLETDGDFVATDDMVLVRDGASEVLLTFDDGMISSVSPTPTHRFEPPKIAGVYGDAERRTVVERSTLPEHVSLSVLAMEDARFFEHPGVDAIGLARALVVNALAGERRQGGSTLTQQLAKNLFLTPTKTIERKIREVALAVALEQRLTKDEILDLYLNQIYLGQVNGLAICGVEQAARTYFNTTAARLTLAQSATLAGIISAPNRYSPTRNPERAQARRDLALDRMVSVGWLDGAAADAAKRSPMTVARVGQNRRAPWAVDWAIDAAEGALGEGVVGDKGLTVQTTIDALLQAVAEEAVATGMQEVVARNADAASAEVALVALDPSNGNILAIIGGRSHTESAFNRASLGARHVGSTIKPLTWMFAYDADPSLGPTSTVSNRRLERRVSNGTWSPRNHDGSESDDISLDHALAMSLNIPAVHVSEVVGVEQLAVQLSTMGLSPQALPSLALGAFEASPLDMASAYTVFPGQGKQTFGRIIDSIRLPNGDEMNPEPVKKQRVSKHRASFFAESSLVRSVEWGTARSAKRYGVGGYAGGKTGTTDGGRDAWFVGFTPSLVVAVWVGHDKGRNLGQTGAQAALPIWARFVAGSGRMRDEPTEVPDDAIAVPVCEETGHFAVPECPTSAEQWFVEGTAAGKTCTVHGAAPKGAAAIIESLRKRVRSADSESRARRGWNWFKRRGD